VPIRAALAPIYLQTDSAWAEWSGIALRDVILKAKQGREIARWRGDLLFTHHGLSGPCALGVTREIAERRDHTTSVEADLLPDVPHERLRAKIAEWIRANPKKLLSTFLEEVVPSRLVDPLARAVGANPSVVLAGLGGKSQNRLVEVLKAWPLGLVRTIPLEKGEVVAGGVPLDEVDQRTMRSLRCGNLFLCGELLDIAGPVGGYNLQAAFSTGYVAGDAAARKILDNA
jgi:predicted Rossmann fold flavoprotein